MMTSFWNFTRHNLNNCPDWNPWQMTYVIERLKFVFLWESNLPQSHCHMELIQDKHINKYTIQLLDKLLSPSTFEISSTHDNYLTCCITVNCLTHSPIHHFETVRNSKKLQTTTEMWILKDFKIQIAYKTLWKKVKLLILSNFTFFHNVFLKLFFLQCVKMSVYRGKG